MQPFTRHVNYSMFAVLMCARTRERSQYVSNGTTWLKKEKKGEEITHTLHNWLAIWRDLTFIIENSRPRFAAMLHRADHERVDPSDERAHIGCTEQCAHWASGRIEHSEWNESGEVTAMRNNREEDEKIGQRKSIKRNSTWGRKRMKEC